MELRKILNLFKRENIEEPPYPYEFLINLDEKEYPKYLKKIFNVSTGKNLNLKHPKTFNEKIQWLKLNDNLPIKTQLTDKILVRDWIKEKIGKDYLKPILWIGNSFDEIPFQLMPNRFIVKANHGCKWNYKIKNKEIFLKTQPLFNFVKANFDSWLNTNFFPFAGFEMQYKNIKPQLLIEEILYEEEDCKTVEYEIYCFNGIPQLYIKAKITSVKTTATVYNKNFEISDLILYSTYEQEKEAADDNLKKVVELSKILSKDFKLVRVDWILSKGKIYFNEMTFTPMSGFFKFNDPNLDLKLGTMLKL